MPARKTQDMKESLKRYQRQLTPLIEWRAKVEQTAALYLPDQDVVNTRFDTTEGERVHLSLERDGKWVDAHFTDWSRSQLLARLGTKELWFRDVSRETEANELNLRLPTLSNMKARLMGELSGDRPSIVVRGLVSCHYAEISDLDVVNALLEHVPDGLCVSSLTAESQRAIYITLVSDEYVAVSGTSFGGFPGVIVRNSEVGYTSLWAVPMLWNPRSKMPTILKKPLLRKTHRGQFDLTNMLHKALHTSSSWWSSFNSKLSALSRITFPDADTARATAYALVVRCGGSKHMADRVRDIFKSTNQPLTGEGILNAITLFVDQESDYDAAYDKATVAGGVLMALID